MKEMGRMVAAVVKVKVLPSTDLEKLRETTKKKTAEQVAWLTFDLSYLCPQGYAIPHWSFLFNGSKANRW
jgi:hypothetical protein